MSAPPVLDSLVAIDTLDALAQRVIRKANEPISSGKLQVIYDDIADGIDSLWMSALLASLSKFSRGPVTQVVASQTTTMISVADPVAPPLVTLVPGSGLFGARQVSCAYCLVTDSGSVTKRSPFSTTSVPAANTVSVSVSVSPVPEGIIGWYAFAGNSVSDLGQQSGLLSLTDSWFEPPAGFTPAPGAPAPPSSNSTGDNIFSIDRIDVQNVDTTWTNWLQSSLTSTFFTEFQHKISTQTTWTPFVYDFIDSRQLEVRPAPAMEMQAVYFYIHRPRRPRFPQSRLPFTSFACQSFLFFWAMAQFLLGIYEYEASDRWMKRAEEERLRIILQISGGNWNKNATIRPFMR